MDSSPTASIPPEGNLHYLGAGPAGDSRPLQTERHVPPLLRHQGKIPARAMETIRRSAAPHQLQLEKVGRNDGPRLSVEPHHRKAFLGEHDQERKHKRHLMNLRRNNPMTTAITVQAVLQRLSVETVTAAGILTFVPNNRYQIKMSSMLLKMPY